MNNNGMTLRVYSWEQIEKMIELLALKLAKKSYINIVGIPRGGMIPAVMLSHKMNLKIPSRLSEVGLKTLWIDDIIETGETLNDMNVQQFNSCCLVNKLGAAYAGVYAEMVEPNTWVVFPWEDIKQARFNYQRHTGNKAVG
jgi:uncharacterized protein